jgi:hypothetical protein
VFLVEIFNLDEQVEELEQVEEPAVYLFEEPCNFTRAFLSIFGEARGDRGPTCFRLCRIVLQSVGDDRDRRRNFLIILLASSHFIGKELFNQLWKELYTVDELYADLDSISGGEFSRSNQESIRLAVASVMASVETKVKGLEDENARLKGLEAEVARLKGLEAEVARLRRDLDDARAGKGPRGR